VQKEFNSCSKGIDNGITQQIIFIRDIYFSDLYQSGQLVSEIDLLLG